MTEVLRMTEVEVFRLCDFDKDSYYEHAIYTRRPFFYSLCCRLRKYANINTQLFSSGLLES